MDEASMNNGHPRVIKGKEVYRSPQSTQGLELLIKHEDMELHLRTRGCILMK